MMEGGAVNWAPALAFLLAGLVVGTIMMWRVYATGRKADVAARDATLERRDLEARRDVLLTQLRELDDSAAKRSPAQLARERYALELEAARTLRALGRRAPSPAAKPATEAKPASPPPTEEAAPAAPPSALRGFLWGAGSVAVLGLLMFFVSQSATPRSEGGSPTGGGPAGASASPQAPDPELQQLLAAAQAKPDDIPTQLALVRAHLEREDMMAVWNETQHILQLDPNQPEALAYQALVRLAMGQADIAESLLKKSIAADPEQRDAYLHLALVYYRLGRVEEGAKIVDDLRKRFPDQLDVLNRIQASLEAQAGEGVAPIQGHENVGSAPEPGATAAGATAPPAKATGPRVAGVLDLAPELKGSVSSGVVFIFARDVGVDSGPPLAVKRLVVSSFPTPFELSSADSMMGGQLPAKIRLEARLDSDGNAMSQDPNDPRAVLGDVAVGSDSLHVVLSR